MNKTLTEADLATLREIEASAATPAPWHHSHRELWGHITTLSNGNGGGIAEICNPPNIPIPGLNAQQAVSSNARLIVAARNNLTALLDTIDERDGIIADLQQDSTAMGIGIQMERQRIRDLIESSIRWWERKPTAERLAAGPVRGLDRLLGDIQGPGRTLPPDATRAEVLRLRAALRAILKLAEHADPDNVFEPAGYIKRIASEALGEHP